MAASLAIAIAAPIGVKQVLTVKTQRTEKAVEQGTAAETLTTPTLQQPSFEGRSDIKSAPNDDAQKESTVQLAPTRNANGLFLEDFQQNGTVKFIDVENDGKCWYWGSSSKCLIHSYDGEHNKDDWAILRKQVQLEAGKFYSLSLDTRVYSAGTKEKFAVMLGNDSTISAMTNVAMSTVTVDNGSYENIHSVFTVPTTGKYFIGIHSETPKGGTYIYVDNVAISNAMNPGIPCEITDLLVTAPGTDGKANVSCTAPSKDISGANLSSITKIEFWRDATPIKTIDNPTPGQKISFVDECGAGTYTWSVSVTNASGTSIVASFKETVIGPRGIPFLKTFPTADSMKEMTILDANNDSKTWYWDKYQKYAALSASETGDDDWLFTPPLMLKAGKVYEWSSLISAGNPNAFPPIVAASIGNAPTAEAMTIELAPKTTITKYDTYFSKEFSVPADGLYYLGIHGCSEKWLALIKLMNINVVGGAELEGPAKVNDAIIEADWSGRTKDVNISFKAPTKTGSDKPLNSITKIEIMRQGIVQKTFNNPTPGAELTYVDKPDAAGEYIYRIVPYNSAGQGGVVEATVNVGAPGKSVPYVEDFSSADRWENELVFIDANNDGTCFWHATSTTPPYAWVHNNGKDGTTFDDYLITPGIELKEGDTYKISADAYGYGHNMSILIGSAPKIADLTNNVKTETLGEDWVNYSGEFVAPYTGKFYIGIRDFAEAGKALSDFHVANIRLDRIGGPGTPAAITNLVITPDATGAPKMTFKFNAPNKTYDNKTLESLTKVTIKRDGAEVKSFENPAPGAALEYTDAPGADGEYSYTFMAFNDKGDGSPTEYLGFAGVDLPALPTNIVATDMGNGKVKITWDPVTKTLHGAEIPAPPIYVVLESGDTDETQLGQTTKCEYIYDAYDVNEQKHFWYAIFPFNSKNEHGSYGKSNDIFAGKAYTLSFLESFENGSPKSPLAIQHLVFSPAWSLCTDATFSDLNSCDGDNGFLAQKGYINNKSVASTGKISLKDAISPTFSFYIVNINPEDYQNEIAVVVREVGNPEWHEIYHKKIREVVPNKGWGRISVDLKAWKGKDIHVGLIPTVNYTDDTHASYYSWTLMDALRVHNLTNKDLGGNMIISSESVDAGQDVDINVTVTNNGEQPSGAYRVDLYKNNKVVDSLNGASLASGKSQVITFSQGTNVADKDQVEFFAKVVLAGDENEKDNTTSVGTIKVNKPIYPAVNGLAAEEMAEAKGSIAVTWTAPSMDQVPPTPFTETFETAPSYSLTDACGWTLVDVDKTPVAGFQQFNFPGITIGTTLASFFVVDNTASELGQFASIFGGNNGSKKSLGSLLAYSGTPDDWAISPELYGGAQVVSFYGKNLQDNMPEKVELWYSTGSLDPNDFIFVKKWDLTNSAYTKYSAYIPEGAKRVAIRHNFEGGILQVDDINFRRAGDTKETVTLKGYNVYRDGELLNENPITAMRYVDTNVEEGDHEYAVNAIYDKGESNSRTVTVHSSSVGDVLEGKTAVYGSYGTIEILNACGQAVTLVSVDGTVLYNGIGQDNMTIRAAAGIYLVKVADKAYKVTVK